MARLIVVTGLDQLPPTERWPRLIAPLAARLKSSGLGELPELESLRRQAEERGIVDETEVAVTLVNFDYGRPFVHRLLEAAGIHHGKPVMPAKWSEFDCSEYFTSTFSEQGYWDEQGQIWLIWTVEEIYEETDLAFLIIGRPGWDGIHWGFRRCQTGLWAYPIDGEFQQLAPTVQALLQGWISGGISL